MKKIINIGLIILGIFILYTITFGKFPNIFGIFRPKPAIIADTPILINEVKAISQLFSVCYYDEIVIDSVVTEKSTILGLETQSTRKLVYIVTGRVYAGFDLSKIDNKSLTVKDSIIYLKLGKPSILDVVINPSDFTTFVEIGKWSFEESTAIKVKAKDKITQRAIVKGIIENCKNNGIKSLTSFYSSLGFKDVIITIEETN
jgi:hypothetical protein